MIFLELVPVSIDELKTNSQWAIETHPSITGINVPDILRIKNRSYDAVLPLANLSIQSIPHIRICDFSEEQLYTLCERLLNNGILHILLISGDPPPNLLQPVYRHNIIHILKGLSNTFNTIDFYAGFDPYRQSLKAEYEYAYNKLSAGAKGLFTQPVFDTHLAHMLLELNLDCNWFIGISPVLTEPSLNYWQTRNNVVFNTNFTPTYDYNVHTLI